MKIILAAAILLCGSFVFAQTKVSEKTESSSTTYKLKWNVDKSFDFDIRTFELPPGYESKIGTNGTIVDTLQLQPLQEFKNNEIPLGAKKSVLIGLVIKSRSGKKADFFVSPHQTEPAIGSLDFKFKCLCYHHVYHLEAGKLWYRVMSLSNRTPSGSIKAYTLTHDIIPWEGELPSSAPEEEHHH